MDITQVLDEIERDVPFYDESGGGATFSGGEPLFQRQFLAECLKACKEKSIHTAVDTSGFAAWNTFEMILPYTDLFLYDLKVMNLQQHKKYTGVSNKPILRNLRKLSELGKGLWVRIPVIPGINDSDQEIEQIGIFLASLPHVDIVELLGYHDIAKGKYESLGIPYALPDILPPSKESLAKLAEDLRDYRLTAQIRYS